jgi:hypothetical protein
MPRNPYGQPESIAHAEVVDRQHVGPAEPDISIISTVQRPMPRTCVSRSMILVLQRVQDFVGRHDPRWSSRQILDAGDLGERQPDRAQLVVGRREHQLRFEQRRRAAFGDTARRSAEDALRRRAVQLLVRDGARQRVERRVLAVSCA